MAKHPIIIVEDDIEDQEIMREVFDTLDIDLELKFFQDGSKVLDYLNSTTDKPLLILTDVNMPGMDGLQLREAIYADDFLRKKSIPYVFLSTSDGQQILQRVYELQIQGFFQKENSFEGMKKQIRLILDYWSMCKHPNNTLSS